MNLYFVNIQKVIDVKSTKLIEAIDQNKKIIDSLIKKSPVVGRSQYVNFFKAEVAHENRCLFPRKMKDGHTTSNNIAIRMNYTYIANQQKALDYITKINNMTVPIDNSQIQHIHEILCEDESSVIVGGLFRNANVRLVNLDILPADWTTIHYKLNKVYDYLADPDIPPVRKAISAHLDLVKIQPFRDYNKRTARLVMNWILFQNGYRPIIFNHSDDWKKYIDAINSSIQHNNLYEEYMMKAMNRTQEDIISLLKNNMRKK